MVQNRYGDPPIELHPGPWQKRREDKVKRIIGVILVLLSGTAYGQLYKCVDKAGRIEYASVCPPGTKQENTAIRNTPGAPASSPASHSPRPSSRRAISCFAMNARGVGDDATVRAAGTDACSAARHLGA